MNTQSSSDPIFESMWDKAEVAARELMKESGGRCSEITILMTPNIDAEDSICVLVSYGDFVKATIPELLRTFADAEEEKQKCTSGLYDTEKRCFDIGSDGSA